VTPEQPTIAIDSRIADVEQQIQAAMRGSTRVIFCPFCGVENRETNEALCCTDLGAVVLAILRKQAQQECLDVAKRIADKIGGN
jgi:hypothetical protein